MHLCVYGRRFRDAQPAEIEALTLEGMRDAVMAQLCAGNLEVSVVGDFDTDELETLALRYLGTVTDRQPSHTVAPVPIALLQPPPHLRHQRWHLKVRRGMRLLSYCAYISASISHSDVLTTHKHLLGM